MIISTLNKIVQPEQGHKAPSPWIGFLLNQAALNIRTRTAMALSAFGISPPQLRALEQIAKNQPLNQTRLGELTSMDRSTIVHVVDHFEQLGIASREADPSDRRTHAIVLTPRGAQTLIDAQASAREAEQDFLKPLSHQEREALRDLLHKLFDPSPCPEEKKHEHSTPPPKS